MKLVYKKDGERPARFYIEITEDEKDLIRDYLYEDGSYYTSDKIYLTNVIVARALGLSSRYLDYHPFMDSFTSRELLSAAKIDIEDPDERQKLISAVYKYLKSRLEMAMSKTVRDERFIPLDISPSSLGEMNLNLEEAAKIGTPFLISIGDKVFEAKLVKETDSFRGYVHRRLKQIVGAYRNHITATLSALRDEYDRKLKEIEKVRETIIPMPNITLSDLAAGMMICRNNQYLEVYLPVKVEIKRVIYNKKSFTLKKEYWCTLRGLAGLALDRDLTIVSTRFVRPKRPSRGVKHPNVNDDGTVCLGYTRQILGRRLNDIHDAYTWIYSVVDLLSTPNFDDAYDVHVSKWAREVYDALENGHSSEVVEEVAALSPEVVWRT